MHFLYHTFFGFIGFKQMLFLLFIPLLFVPATLQSAQDRLNISIGVLAKRSAEQCLKQWQPLADYMNQTIAGYNFIIVPLGFDEIEKAVANKSVDFTVSNPAIYVAQEAKFKATRIATMHNYTLGAYRKQFAGVIFTRKDRQDIREVSDLKNKSFIAVSPTSFGGWLTSWRYLKEHGIFPERHFKKLSYGGSHDVVVRNVLNGKADAGAVRSGVLELMAMEGKIKLADFHVLDEKRLLGDNTLMHTTHLYPEWAFAMLADTDIKLAEKVAIALLDMPQSFVVSGTAKNATWTIPLDYQSVHQCLQELQVSPYEAYGQITWRHMVEQHLALLLSIAAILIITVLTTIYFLALNRRIKATAMHLDRELAANAIMEERLQQFKQTLDQTLDCIFMFEPENLNYIYANHGAIEQVGYSLEELLNMTTLELKPDFSEEQYRALLQPLILEKKKSITFRTTHRTKKNTDLPVEIVQQYIELVDGQNRFVSIVRDISDRLAEEQEKEKLHTQLLHAQKLESVGQLAAGIAHEINTPAQFIGTNIDFMDEANEDIATFMQRVQQIAQKAPAVIGGEIGEALEEADWEYLSEELPRAITQSREGIKRVSTIVLAMKEFSHPSSKEKIAQDLNHIVETTMTVARNEWRYVAAVELDLDPDLPQVPLLADEIGQVILNVLVNGAHAIREKLGDNPDGEKGTMTISTRKKSDTVELRISDTGMGIPEEVKDHIFDPFYTTKEVGKGTGQGLAISHDVITEKHGGTIWFTTEVGKGTVFIISLPLAEENRASRQVKTNSGDIK